jgi:hypothetical protein
MLGKRTEMLANQDEPIGLRHIALTYIRIRWLTAHA